MSLAAKLWERSREWVLFGVLFLTSVIVLVQHDGSTLRAVRASSLAVTARGEGLFAGISSPELTPAHLYIVAGHERLRNGDRIELLSGPASPARISDSDD